MTGAIFLSCLYDDVDPTTYEGIELRMRLGAKREVFNTGNPFHDYLTANIVAFLRAGEHACVMGSSSVDHFSMDGGHLPCASLATDEQLETAREAARAYLGNKLWCDECNTKQIGSNVNAKG